MPKRTTTFQKLVYLVKRTTVEGTVTESKMLPDLLEEGKEVEVDVCLETTVGGHPIILCIECIEHSRPADRNWVLTMKAKHDRLPTSKLVLASKKGFSASAVRVARDYKIDLLPYTVLSVDQVHKILGDLSALSCVSYALSVSKVLMDVPSEGELAGERVHVAPFTSLFTAKRKEAGSVKDLVDLILGSEMTMRYFAKEADDSHRFFTAEWTLPLGEIDLYLEKLEPKMLRRVARVEIQGRCRFTKARLDLTPGKLGAAKVIWGKGELFERKGVFAIVDPDAAPPRLSVAVDAATLGPESIRTFLEKEPR